jgi:O-antigen/teichoic acid export membrane protein
MKKPSSTIDLRTNSLYTVVGGGFRLVIGLITGPLTIRLLGVQDYGVLSVATSVVGLAGMVEFGLASALTIHLASEYARNDSAACNRLTATAFWLLTGFAAITSLALWLSSGMLATRLFAVADQAGGLLTLQVLVLSLIPRVWQNVAIAIESAVLRYDLQVKVELPYTMATQVGLCLVAWKAGTPAAAALWTTLSVVCVCAVHALVLRGIFAGSKDPWRFCWSAARRLFVFGVPLWINSLSSILFNNADRLIVNGVLGSVAVGIYSAGVNVASKMVELTGMVIRVLPPAVSAAAATGNEARVRFLFLKAIRVNGGVTLLGGGGLLFMADPIAYLFVGPQYAAQAAPVLRILGLVYSYLALVNMAGCFGLGLNRPGMLAKWGLASTACMLGAMQLFSGWFGLTGAAWSNAGYLLNCMVTVGVARLLGFNAASLAKAFAASVLAPTLCWILTASPWFGSLPWIWQGLAYLVLTPPLLFWVMGLSGVLELRTTAAQILRRWQGLPVAASSQSAET